VTPDSLFSLAGLTAMAGWLLLIFAPRRFPRLNALPVLVIPFGLSLIYAVLVLIHFSGNGGGYDSLQSVRLLLASDWALLAGWVHYLAFDLMVGAAMAVRMDRAGIGRLVQGAILPLVFLFGPLGLVVVVMTEIALRPLHLSRKGRAHVHA